MWICKYVICNYKKYLIYPKCRYVHLYFCITTYHNRDPAQYCRQADRQCPWASCITTYHNKGRYSTVVQQTVNVYGPLVVLLLATIRDVTVLSSSRLSISTDLLLPQ